ncbi:MAG: HlyD family efflux transporter periplasmic adaptor subunit [Bacteroidota bacterium]
MKRSIIFNTIGAIGLSLMLFACGQPVAETKPVIKDVTETVFASGSLEAEGMYSLTAQTTGYLTELNFAEGDIVAKGEVLAVIENSENLINTQGASELLNIAKSNTDANAPLLRQAEYDIQIKKEKMEQDQKTEARYKRLLESQSIARIEYENALLNYNTSQKNYQSALENYNKLKRDADQQVVNNQTNVDIYSSQLAKNKVEAVIRGKVYKKYKEVGDYVRQGDIIAEIGNPELLYAEVNIDESNISRIEKGQEAVIQLNTDKEKTYKGVVKEIDPSFDASTQSFVCKLYFTEELEFKIVNTQLQSNIIIGEQQNALLIPRNFLDYGGYVQIKGVEEKTKVETQFVSNEWVQVLSGIDENTTLVTNNVITQK